jgi:peptide/nickel transport system substrate-binding protein
MNRKHWAFCIGLILTILLAASCSAQSTPTKAPPASTPALISSPAPAKPTVTTTVPSTSPSQPVVTPTSPAPAPGSPKTGGVLKVVSDSMPGGAIGYPPEIVTASVESTQLCMDPFLRGDNKGAILPWLAESYKVADDLKSITFVLRKGIKFHDGSDFNSMVAKWNLENQINAKTQPTWASIDAVDDYTVRVNLKSWNNTVLSGFIDGSASWMVSKVAFDKNGLDWVRQNPVGTGAFKFVSFSRDVGFKTIKNPDYWKKDSSGGKLPYLNGVEIVYVVDALTQKAVMQSKGADAIKIAAGKTAADMKAMGLAVQTSITVVNVLIPDTVNTDSVWANQKVREAVEYSIDREQIAQALGYGYWQAPYQMVPRAYPAYDPNFSGRKFDPQKAKQLLNEAGFSSGFKTTIIVNPLTSGRDVAVAMQNNLAQVGIDAALDFPDFSKFQTAYVMGNWKNAALFSVFPGATNLNTTLQTFYGPASPMLKSWIRTEDFIKLYNASLNAVVPDIELTRAVTNWISKTAAVIPINENGYGWAMQSYVMNGGWFQRSSFLNWNSEQTWLDK